jgi:hypothetical protein
MAGSSLDASFVRPARRSDRTNVVQRHTADPAKAKAKAHPQDAGAATDKASPAPPPSATKRQPRQTRVRLPSRTTSPA